MPAIPCCSLLAERKALPTFSLCRTITLQHGLRTMHVKAWDNTIHKDGISIVLIRAVKNSVTTIHPPMMMPSYMATTGIVSAQKTQISIHLPHNGKLLCRTLRTMRDGAVAVYNSSTTQMMATTIASITIRPHIFSARRRAASMPRHTLMRYM